MIPFLHDKRYSVWVGLTDEADEGNWTFTDGTTLPEEGTFLRTNGRSNQNCARLGPAGLFDRNCNRNLSYICMTMGNYK